MDSSNQGKETLECYILDQSFKVTSIIDNYESFIWTDRYDQCGDFELVIPASSPLREKLINEYYIYNKDSEHLMIIESNELTTNIEEGDKYIVRGRSIESILDRRIIYKYKETKTGTESKATNKIVYTELSGSLQEGIKTILENNVIFPNKAQQDEPRKLELFEFEPSSDKRVTDLQYEGKFLGESVYDTMCTICQSEKLGWKVNFDQNKCKFIIRLYFGTDRSYDQLENNDLTFYKITELSKSSGYKIVRIGANDRQFLKPDGTEIPLNSPDGLEKNNESYFKNTFLDSNILELSDKEKYDVLTYKVEKTGAKFATFMIEDIRSLALNPYVIFSPSYDNLLETDYKSDISNFKNFTLIGGEESEVKEEVKPDPDPDDNSNSNEEEKEEEDTKKVKKFKEFAEYGEGTGMERKEIYTDASSVSRSTNEDNSEKTKSDAEYKLELKEKGAATLNEHKLVDAFEGTIAEYGMFLINRDYFIGDIVQIKNSYNMMKVARITEMIFSKDDSGYRIYPTYQVDAINEEYTIKYISDNMNELVLGACAPTRAKYGTPFIVSNPTSNTDNRYFEYWNISGMDTSTHYVGDDADNFTTTQKTEINKVPKKSTDTSTTEKPLKKVWYKNLRQTKGEVVFSAHFSGTPTTDDKGCYVDYDLKGNSDVSGVWPTKENGYKGFIVHNPTEMKLDTGYEVSIPVHPDDEDGFKIRFVGWNITGLDSKEHLYGSNKYNAIKTNATSILDTTASWFKNLNTSGQHIKFTAIWE